MHILSRIGLAMRLLCALFLFSEAAHAQDTLQRAAKDTTRKHRKPNRFVEFVTKRRNFLLAPQIDRAPETGIMTGVYYLQLYKSKKDTEQRASNTELYLSVSQKSQYVAELNENLLFDKGRFIIRGSNMFSRYNEFFYGIGNLHDLKHRDLIEFNFFQTTQRVTRKLTHKLYAGGLLQFYRVYNLSYPDEGIMKVADVMGKYGSTTVGFGPVFLYDSRDNVIYTTRGFFLDLSALLTRREFGSIQEFNNVTLDVRSFHKIYRNNVLCFQGIFNYNDGDVPFRQMALLGSDQIMRGFYMGSYRDKVMACGQAEARIPIWRWIGMTVFTAVGEVQPDVADFNFEDLRLTYGFGLRFTLVKQEHVNTGGDLGFGRNTKALYFGTGEAF